MIGNAPTARTTTTLASRFRSRGCVSQGSRFFIGFVLLAFYSLLGSSRVDMIHLDCCSTRGLALSLTSSPACLSMLSDHLGGSLRLAWHRACLDVFVAHSQGWGVAFGVR